jgi:hypothetical protein
MPSPPRKLVAELAHNKRLTAHCNLGHSHWTLSFQVCPRLSLAYSDYLSRESLLF